MTLTQPVVGSVGWGDAVNLNFQTLEDFCNGIPGSFGVGSVPVASLALANEGDLLVYHAPNWQTLPAFGAQNVHWENLGDGFYHLVCTV